MLKLFRNSHVILRLCESKQCLNLGLFNNVKLSTIKKPNIVMKFNRSWQKCYSTQQLEDMNPEDNQKNEAPDIQDITCGDPELEHKLKVIMLEAEVMRQEGQNTPSKSFLKKHHWQELLRLPTRTARKRYLVFLFKIEMKKENITLKKEQKRLQKEMMPKPEFNTENGQIIYSLMHNNIFLRFYDTTMNHFYNNKLIQAIMFGQQLVVDCGYDKNMTTRENINCAKQLMLLFSDNRAHDEPYDLHFCNLSKDGVLGEALKRQIVTMYEPWFPLNTHEKNYCDVFSKDKLIYLTPHCREEMVEYDHDAVYIIGAIVDKVNIEPLSMAKAKREGIRMMKLPLDRYLQWGSGSGKSLTLNQVISILLDVKKTGDWKYAFRHVPRRKLERETMYPSLSKALSDGKEEYPKNNTLKRSRREYERIQRHQNSIAKPQINIKSIFKDD